MATDELTFLILEYVGIVLYLYLFGHCVYRSINYTLQVICVVGILNNINETFIVLMFDDRVMTHAHGTSACIISAVFEQFLPLSIALLTTCMGFNIWFLIVRKSRKKEKQILKWYCLVSFGVSAFATAIAVLLLRDQPYFATYTRKYYCDLEESYTTLGTFAIPMLLAAMPGIFFAGRTIVYLVTQYYRLRRTLNRPSVTGGSNMTLELSHCVRLLVYCFGFSSVVLLAVLERMIETRDQKPGYNEKARLAVLSDFSGSLIAFAVFFIFGTTRESFRTMSKIICLHRRCKLRQRSRDLSPEDEVMSINEVFQPLPIVTSRNVLRPEPITPTMEYPAAAASEAQSSSLQSPLSSPLGPLSYTRHPSDFAPNTAVPVDDSQVTQGRSMHS